MKFDYMNDIHLDFWVRFNNNQVKFEKNTRLFAQTLLPENPSNILIIGGDLGHFNRQNYWFLDELSKIYSTIILVFGNHDYYLISGQQEKKYKKNSMNRITEMKELANSLANVVYLEGQLIELEGTIFGGTGMWYDFSYGQHQNGLSLDDVRAIWANHSNDFKLIRGFTTMDKFQKELEQLESVLSKADVIISHVGPDVSLSPYKGEHTKHNSYYFFDGSSILENMTNKTWCFGHVHLRQDIMKNGWRFINYALGYPDEQGFMKFQQIEV